MNRTHRILALGIGAALLLAACSTSPSPSPSPSPMASESPSMSESPMASESPSMSESPMASESPSMSESPSSLVIDSATSASLGSYLSGPDGMTLYIFTQDGTDTSACTGACATTWPALTVQAGEQITAGLGVTGAFSTFVRDDGTTQVSYAGHPLYYYSGDVVPGDTNGQGLNGSWFVAPASGELASPGA